MHPNNRRMLAITRRSTLVTFDIAKLFSVNSTYSGLRCSQSNLQPCFSPDGRYIICGLLRRPTPLLRQRGNHERQKEGGRVHSDVTREREPQTCSVELSSEGSAQAGGDDCC